MKKGEVIRFWAVCTVAVIILTGNAILGLNEIKSGQNSIHYDLVITEDTPVITENSSKPIISQKSKNESSQESLSEPASTEAVLGKIISKYISPYNTAPSYDGVYLKNSTGEQVNLKKLLESGSKIKLNATDEPQVLIMHTHTTESFMLREGDYYTEKDLTRTTDNQKNMARIGEIVAKRLNSAGVSTIHDTTKHDYPQYTGSYGRAADTIKGYLKKYPTIKIVLDLHRDSVSSGESDKVKLVKEVDGKKAAQVMLVMGSQTGGITQFPNWEENLKLAVRLQQIIERDYPALARPIMLNSKKYNQNLTTGSLLLEFGTEANTLAEAEYSAELVSKSLIKLFEELQE